jgi:hypothetical protein
MGKVKPVAVTPEVPGSILGNPLGIFSESETLSDSHLTRGVLVRKHVSVLYTGHVKEPRGLFSKT